MATRRLAALLFCWMVGGDPHGALAQTVDRNPVSWFADFFDPVHGTGGSRGTFTFVDAVPGLPTGGVVLAGSVSPTDVSFVFQVTLHLETRRPLTTIGVQGADVTAAGWIRDAEPDGLVDFIGAAPAFNDVQMVLDGTLDAARSTDLFFVSFSGVTPGTVLGYWVFEALAGARIFVGNVTVLENPADPPPEPFVLYDDFEEGARMDPDKWLGDGGARPVLDARRAQAGGRLHLLNGSYAATDANIGSQTGQIFVAFTHPTAVRAIQTTVMVEALEATRCVSSGEPGRVSAQIFGSFFNAGLPTPNSHLNDVAISIDVSRSTDSSDSNRTLRINAGVLLCTTDNCSQASILSGQSLGTVLRGQPVRLAVQWDPGNDRFILQRDARPEIVLAYSVPDKAPAGLPNKILAVNSTVPNCTSNPRPAGMMRVSFEDVFVNLSAAR